MSETNVEFQANGETTPGFLARPEQPNGRALVVLQEWWGVVPEVIGTCNRLAEAGYYALAPDLYRGETADQPDEAEQKMMALEIEQTARDLSGAIDFVAAEAGTEKVGTLGWCLGGGLSVVAASLNDKVAACVSYYYVLPHKKPDFSKIVAPVLMHWGSEDAFNEEATVDALVEELRAAGVDVTSETYDGCGHAFANAANRLGTYDAEAAQLAWSRSIEFFNRWLP